MTASDLEKLPHLLKLLDDHTPVVRKAVAQEFLTFGPSLEKALALLQPPPDGEIQQNVQSLIHEYLRNRLKEAWARWINLRDEKEKLETGLSLLADFLSESRSTGRLTDLLDDLALEYRRLYKDHNAQQLAKFLFQDQGFKGARDDYHDPAHSNLSYVIEKKTGLPISLACVYILLGARLEMKIEGCNFPARFLARTFVRDEMMFVDCFNEGKWISKEALRQAHPDPALEKVMNQAAQTDTIILRVLANLTRAFQEKGVAGKSHLMQELVQELQPDRATDTGTL